MISGWYTDKQNRHRPICLHRRRAYVSESRIVQRIGQVVTEPFDEAKKYVNHWVRGEIPRQIIYKIYREPDYPEISEPEFLRLRHEQQESEGYENWRDRMMDNEFQEGDVYELNITGYPPDEGILPFLQKINENPDVLTVISNSGMIPDGYGSPPSLTVRFRNNEIENKYVNKLEQTDYQIDRERLHTREGLGRNVVGIYMQNIATDYEANQFWEKVSNILAQQ